MPVKIPPGGGSKEVPSAVFLNKRLEPHGVEKRNVSSLEREDGIDISDPFGHDVDGDSFPPERNATGKVNQSCELRADGYRRRCRVFGQVGSRAAYHRESEDNGERARSGTTYPGSCHFDKVSHTRYPAYFRFLREGRVGVRCRVQRTGRGYDG